MSASDTIQCPKCASPMSRLDVNDISNGIHWLSAEFVVCDSCAYPMLISMQTSYGELQVLSCDVALFAKVARP